MPLCCDIRVVAAKRLSIRVKHGDNSTGNDPSCPRIAVRKNGVASLAYVAGIHVFIGHLESRGWLGQAWP
jgi:hypothetical protein